jgi:protein-L-isoaspartate(D-aspartate) O-methyltransferase
MKPLTDQHFATLRRHMVEVIDIEFELAAEEIGRPAPAPSLREALLAVPRHLFVPSELKPMAYQNQPLPIGFGKTISQPFMGALMAELLDLTDESIVLEVGTGLGYLSAVLARVAAEIYSVEVVEEFAAVAEARLQELGAANFAVRVGDGSRGWEEAGPFDAILVSAAVTDFPDLLFRQLKDGGRMVLPLDRFGTQRLVQGTRDGNQLIVREIMAVTFTPLETVF